MNTKAAIFGLLSCSALLVSPLLALAGDHGRAATVSRQRFSAEQVLKYSNKLGPYSVRLAAKPLAKEFLADKGVQSIIAGRPELKAIITKGLVNVTKQIGQQLQPNGSVAVKPGLQAASSWNHASYRDFGHGGNCTIVVG